MASSERNRETFYKLCREAVIKSNPGMSLPDRRGIRPKKGAGILLINREGRGFLYRFLWEREVSSLEVEVEDFMATLDRVSRLYNLEKKVLITRFNKWNIRNILEIRRLPEDLKRKGVEIMGIEEFLKTLGHSFGVTANDITEENLPLLLEKVERVKRAELFRRYGEGGGTLPSAPSLEGEGEAIRDAEAIRPPSIILMKANSSFPPQMVKRINEIYRGGDTLSLEGEFDDLVVLMADMCSFTTFIRNSRDFPLIKEMMQLFYTSMREEIFRHNGILDKFIGDGVLAIFGYPFKEGVYWKDALSCALNMVRVGKEIGRMWQERIDVMIQDIGLRVGLSLGKLLIAGTEEGGGELIILGDPINLASRLQSSAKPNQVLLSNLFNPYLKDDYAMKKRVIRARGIGDIVAWELGKRLKPPWGA